MPELDLSDARQYAEAVAYGKLLAVRQILDTLASESPSAMFNAPAYVQGYARAVAVVKAIKLGVEKS